MRFMTDFLTEAMEARRQCNELFEVQKESFSSVQFSSVAQSCLILCNPMDWSMPGFPVHHQLPELTQTHVHWVGDADSSILWMDVQPSHPLLSPLLSPLIFPSIRVFWNESVIHIRCPKYWSLSFSISPSNEAKAK